jgi:type I restriction enzyme, S subunit
MTNLPAGWRYTPLEDVVEASIGGLWGDPPDAVSDSTTEAIVIRGAEFRDWAASRARTAPKRRVPSKALQTRRLQAGDLVVEVSGGGPTQPVGRVILVDHEAIASATQPMVSSNFCRRVVLSGAVNSRFVWYQLMYMYERGDTVALQTATTNLRNLRFSDYLTKMRLAIPPLGQQERIVAAIETEFSRIGAGMAALLRVRKNLKHMRAAVLEAAVTGKLVPRSVTDNADGLLVRMAAERFRTWKYHSRGVYKAPAAPGPFSLAIPNHWRICSLEAITHPVRVICYGILMPKENIIDGIPYVRVKDMKGWTIDVSGLRRTSRKIADQYARASLKAGDLLLAIRGSFGRVAIIPRELDGANITQDSARIAAHDAIDRRYLLYYLGGSVANRYYNRVARGVAVKGVNIGDVRSMPVPVPPQDEQIAIADEVERHFSFLDRIEVAVEVALRRGSSLRAACLAAAFSGRLVPQNAKDEPRSLLVERMVAEHSSLKGQERRIP